MFIYWCFSGLSKKSIVSLSKSIFFKIGTVYYIIWCIYIFILCIDAYGIHTLTDSNNMLVTAMVKILPKVNFVQSVHSKYFIISSNLYCYRFSILFEVFIQQIIWYFLLIRSIVILTKLYFYVQGMIWIYIIFRLKMRLKNH